MANLNLTLNSTLTVADAASSSTLLSRLMSATFGATATFEDEYFQAATNPTTVNLPGATARAVIVLNKGANNITVSYTPSGGSSTSVVLQPGDIFVYFQTAALSGGITALSLQATTATTAALVFAAA